MRQLMRFLGGSSMLGKLLKNDLKRNMKWMWILFLSTIMVAGVSRGCKELGENIVFFKILSIIFDSVFYSLLVNVILQPFLRNFLNFSKSLYGDESYLTHTLPVNKNQIINSKFLTALIEILLGFATLVISLVIMFASPTFLSTIEMIISMIVIGKISVWLVLGLFILLVIVEFLMFLSIIFFSIVLAYRAKEKRVLKTFLFTALMSFLALTVLSIFMMIVLLANDVNIMSANLVLSSSAFIGVLITGILVYSAVIIVFYFLTKKVFRKGVNVD